MRLSICIAFHRRHRWLGELLDSILDSGYHFRDTEILLCDDGSDESVPSPVAPFLEKRPDLFRVIRNDQNLGIAASRQRLAREARGTYIMSFDSDDIFVPFDIDKSLNWLDEHQDYSAVYGKKMLFNAERGFTGMSHGGAYSTIALLTDPRMTQIGMILRRSDVLDSYGYMLPSGKFCPVAEDVNCWVWLGCKKKMQFFHEIRAFYRQHPGQLTKDNRTNYGNAYDIVRDEFINVYRPLYDRIMCGGKMMFSSDEIKPAVILCGVIYARAQNIAQRLNILSLAIQLMPDDYGTMEFFARSCAMVGQKTEAMAWITNLLSAGQLDDYYYNDSLAYGLADELLRDTPLLNARFKKLHEDALNRLFVFTQSQHQLLQKVVESARKYDLSNGK